MHLHTLTLSNVGPFTGTTSIDFSRLTAGGMFLLEGPTGSGKSTILDSIVFALFGKVAGADSSEKRMRSDFADPSAEPGVELTFETASGIYRVARSPQYDRPSKRGGGMTTSQASVKLWRLGSPDSPGGELLSNRMGEADDELARIIGLSRSQFVQTVVLPQGEFSTFLKAKPQDRGAVLQKLFGTHLYERIAQELADDRKAAHAERNAALASLGHAITAFATAAGCDPGVRAVLLELSGDQLSDGLTAIVDELAAASAAAAEALSLGQLALAGARDSYDEARSRAALLERRNALLSRQTALEAQRDDCMRASADLERLSAVQTGIPSRNGLLAARERQAQAQTSVQRSCAEVERRFPDAEHADRALPSWRDSPAGAAIGLRALADQLVHMADTEAGLTDLANDFADASLRQRDYEDELAHLNEDLNSYPAKLHTQQQLLASLRSASDGMNALQADHDRANARLTAVKAADELSEQIVHSGRRVAELGDQASARNAEAAAARAARISGIAGELAASLVDDQPCAVCGSPFHPAPAAPASGAVTPEQVAAAEGAAAAALAALEAARASHDELDRELVRLRAAADGHTVESAKLVRKQCWVLLEAATLAVQQLPGAELELARLQAGQESAAIRTTELTGLHSAAQQAVKALKRQITADSAAVAHARGDCASVSDKISSLSAQAGLLDGYATARAELTVSERALAMRQAEFAEVLAALGIADEMTFDDLRGQLASIPQLRARIDSFEREDAAVTDGLADPALADLGDGAPADLAALQRALNDADSHCTQSLRISDAAQRRWQGAAAQAAHTAAAAAHVTAVHLRTEPVIRIANIVNANGPDNLLHMPLPTYVLRARFRDVVAAANLRLAGMSDGRYALEHTDERDSRGRTAGLGLRVRDHLTEKTRATGDLSGGEGFYTALALALGLADVVTAESGGITLGTLFIDEGFGTLDHETLDSVMAEIASLRSGGRTVGVVSHVDELRSRIPNRISLHATSAGSSTISVLS